MAIIRAAVGDIVQEFKDDTGLDEVWRFIDKHMALSDVERAVVLMDQGGATIGEIWDRSLYYAHWETPNKMRSYLDLAGFDQDD